MTPALTANAPGRPAPMPTNVPPLEAYLAYEAVKTLLVMRLERGEISVMEYERLLKQFIDDLGV